MQRMAEIWQMQARQTRQQDRNTPSNKIQCGEMIMKQVAVTIIMVVLASSTSLGVDYPSLPKTAFKEKSVTYHENGGRAAPVTKS